MAQLVLAKGLRGMTNHTLDADDVFVYPVQRRLKDSPLDLLITNPY